LDGSGAGGGKILDDLAQEKEGGEIGNQTVTELDKDVQMLKAQQVSGGEDGNQDYGSKGEESKPGMVE